MTMNKAIKEFVENACKKYSIKDLEHIKQLIKSQEIQNYLDYNNKILPKSMEEVPQKMEGNDLKFIK